MNPDLTDPGYRESLRRLYRDTLLHDVMPFWLKHGMDREPLRFCRRSWSIIAVTMTCIFPSFAPRKPF
jgi:hypothetical protein